MATGSVSIARVRFSKSNTAQNNFYIEQDEVGNLWLYRGNPGSGTRLQAISDNGLSPVLSTAVNGLTSVEVPITPSTKRVTIYLAGVQASTTNVPICRGRNAAGVITSGYTSAVSRTGSSSVASGDSAPSYHQLAYNWSSAAYSYSGKIEITRISSNVWFIESSARSTIGTTEKSSGYLVATDLTGFQFLFSGNDTMTTGTAAAFLG